MTFFIFWLMCGVLALAIDCWVDYQNGKDIKANDIPYMIIGICLGIFTLLFITVVFLKRTEVVLIKGKSIPKDNSEEKSEPDLKKSALEDK